MNPQLIYPHHMVVVWLEYILLVFVLILFIDLIIALVLIYRSRSALLLIQNDVANLRISNDQSHTELTNIRTECEKLSALCVQLLPKEEPAGDLLKDYLSTLSDEQKQVVSAHIDTLATTRNLLPFGLSEDRVEEITSSLSVMPSTENHSGYSTEVLNEQASLDVGIPLYDKITVASAKSDSKRRASSIKSRKK